MCFCISQPTHCLNQIGRSSVCFVTSVVYLCMTSASELFYSRRHRLGRTSNDLEFDSLPDLISTIIIVAMMWTAVIVSDDPPMCGSIVTVHPTWRMDQCNAIWPRYKPVPF